MKKKVPSLVDLCIRIAIDNVRYLGDVGETDIDLLGQILPHCTVDQLMHIEKSTEVSSNPRILKVSCSVGTLTFSICTIAGQGSESCDGQVMEDIL